MDRLCLGYLGKLGSETVRTRKKRTLHKREINIPKQKMNLASFPADIAGINDEAHEELQSTRYTQTDILE